MIERNDRTDVIRKRQYHTQRTVQLWIKADERINRTAHKEQISKKLCLHYIDILRSLIENLSMSKFSNLLFSLTWDFQVFKGKAECLGLEGGRGLDLGEVVYSGGPFETTRLRYLWSEQKWGKSFGESAHLEFAMNLDSFWTHDIVSKIELKKFVNETLYDEPPKVGVGSFCCR